MIALGIEGTAHTLGVGIIKENGSTLKILANSKSQYVNEKGGIHPREASEHHAEVVSGVIKDALSEARVSLKDVDLITYSQSPGLGPCLRIAATAARALSVHYEKPLVGVNHCIAHIEIGRKTCECDDPITTYVSGANTQIIGFEEGRYRVYGECLDQGVGNVLDSFAREIGHGFPGGPVLDKMALKGGEYIDLPYTVKGMDLAFAGVLTEAISRLEKHSKEDVAYSLMENVTDMVVEVTERALAHTGKKQVMITGGVAASEFLRRKMQLMCDERGAEFFVPDKSLCVDNGAMIAWTGLLMHEHGVRTRVEDAVIKPKERTDHVSVTWR